MMNKALLLNKTGYGSMIFSNQKGMRQKIQLWIQD